MGKWIEEWIHPLQKGETELTYRKVGQLTYTKNYMKMIMYSSFTLTVLITSQKAYTTDVNVDEWTEKRDIYFSMLCLHGNKVII